MEIGLLAIIGFIVGGVVSFFIVKGYVNKLNESKIADINAKADIALEEARLTVKRIIDEAETKAEKIVGRAEQKNEIIKQQKIGEAKKKYAKLKEEYNSYKSEFKVEIKEREINVVNLEKEIKKKEQSLSDKMDSFDSKEQEIVAIRENLEKQIKVVAKKKEEISKANDTFIEKLETIAKLSQDEAKAELLDAIKSKTETEALSLQKDLISEAKSNAAKEAKKIIINTIQRMNAEFTIENTVTVFNLNSDDIKGQIIGREGRNIRALEAATGAEIVVDDTPEAIVISSFDPIRRELCRLSLKKLLQDGRIHPAKIEEVVAKTRKQLEEQIKEIGERTIIDLNIHGLKAPLVRMVGRMRFRSSYGQNLLKHSIETAHLCATMAAEIGLSKNQIKMAKRAGLLHDIGKVAEEESELPHAPLGMEICKKHGEHPVILNAVGAHHDEIEMNNIISPIVQACDSISGARPGARREILESYLKRITDLEDLALGYEGVQKAYALQAGRELRVIVESDKVNDGYAEDLSFMISQKIQDEMQYPGQVKVTVIREVRASSIAR